jgi:hypothetical protein
MLLCDFDLERLTIEKVARLPPFVKVVVVCFILKRCRPNRKSKRQRVETWQD